ncbi:VOC family protein [Actinophytocola xanthii]|uniref:Glyoxalase n=1 Tax=Actinophytocola xanthii TaxID=1912961 RepID=A0A1Q8CMZ7_9PSEU|nr:VOC family protein [Actinophytocola xanthii]OLF15736.1 glyoxalase [Actinophytocola xanthii]
MSVPTLSSVVLDCPDPKALADFYARLLDLPPDAEAEPGAEWATLKTPNGISVEFQRADDYSPPTWPDPERQQMFHLDLHVEDMDAAHERAVDLGAKHLDTQRTFRVFADPAGHPFCLCG